MAIVQAKKAQDFHNSFGVCTHFEYPAYRNSFPEIKTILLDIGFKIVRDNDRRNIPKLKELAASGIKTIFIISPWIDAIVPDSSFAINSTAERITPAEFVEDIGASTLFAIEHPNEIDLFYKNYFYSQSDRTPLNANKSSKYWWRHWIDKYVRATYANIKASKNPAVKNIAIIAPSPGVQYNYDNLNPMAPMGDYCTYGNAHYYPQGTGFKKPITYAGIENYYYYGCFPGNAEGRKLFPGINDKDLTPAQRNQGEDGNTAMFRACSEIPYGGLPMIITETGETGGASDYSITYRAWARLGPRRYVENFRLGFKVTCNYEFLDQGSNTSEGVGAREESFGLVRHDLSYKPVAVQLKALIGIIKETGTDTRASAGSLDYTLDYVMPEGYTEPNFVKQVLLQKANGTFILLVYHNVASADATNGGISVEKFHPLINATISFPVAHNIMETRLRDDYVAPVQRTAINVKSYSFEIKDRVGIIVIS